MPQRYSDAIIKYLSSRDYMPLKPRQLARQMGVGDEDYSSFRQAIKMLRDSARIVLGAKDSLMLPEISDTMVGVYRANPRGFGFILPETPNAHGDLYVPEGETGGAMSGDTVRAKVFRRGGKAGETIFHGRIIEIIRRGSNRIVGTLQRAEGSWFLLPDGKSFSAPVLVPDVGPGALVGQKVVVELTQYPEPGQLARGVVVENLGASGAIAAETESIIRAQGLPTSFDPEVLEEARLANAGFNPQQLTPGREDLTGKTIVTIDPPDARDFDDAISLEMQDGQFVLGIHIADVSHFIAAGGALDNEARLRGNSVYFPRRVIPMLPEVLSNGVCSLQENQRRFCKSAFIRYDSDGNVTGTRLAETVICSAKRLTYIEAQGIIDGKAGGYEREVVELLRRMNDLAQRIERRRRSQGMIHLDLPEVKPVFNEEGKVIDAEPDDESYTHTIIEMFMVEANEAVARTLDKRNIAFLRRIHPAPDQAASVQLASFIKVCGHKLPKNFERREIQQLLESVKGQAGSHAVNLAVLKSFRTAEYSPIRVGHFALASDQYCHFTSPIRRYADLTVHRLVEEVVRELPSAGVDMSALVKLGDSLSMSERRAEAAERELITVLVLQLLETKVGDVFDGVVTGVANFGLFAELPRYGIEGLVRMEDLGDDWWEVFPKSGEIRGERSGRKFRIGDPLAVQVASVNVPGRQLNLVLTGQPSRRKADKKGQKQSQGKAGKPSRGPRSRRRAR